MGQVYEIQFASQGVYQVLVDDSWVILQFNENDECADTLCSCEEHEEKQTCSHVNLAREAIYQSQKDPLHSRFKRSLWNKLCQLSAEKIGFDAKELQEVNPHHYVAFVANGKSLVEIEATTKGSQNHLNALLFKRPKETEETSLKFSLLPQEEIMLWREGRPSFDLRYELSFWSDLAKWMQLLQEEGKNYQITFSYSSKQLPQGISISFPGLKCKFYISFAQLPLIIPTLAHVNSPLKVYAPSLIQKMEYLPEEKSFVLHREGEKLQRAGPSDQKGIIKIDEWLYVPKVGFYSHEKDQLLSQDRISFPDIPLFLQNHSTLIEQTLSKTKFSKEIHLPSYHLSFDTEDNLIIEAYLFERGDLQRTQSLLFGHYVYIEDEGFFQIEDLFLNQLKTVIPKEEISHFIAQNRVWLSAQEGFATHLTSVQVQLNYQMSEPCILRFDSEIGSLGAVCEAKDFGEWLYVPGEGFYAKHFALVGGTILPGTKVEPNDIGLFLHMHQEELEQIKGFFTSSCPLLAIRLKIQLTKDQAIAITPSVELLPGYQEKDLKFFGDFVYVPDEGFSPIPSHLRLPEQYRRPTTILQKQIEFFLSQELPSLRPFIEEIDPRLTEPSELVLTLDDLRRTEEGLWQLRLGYETEEGGLDLDTIWKGFIEGKRYHFTSLGAIDLHNPAFQWLKQLDASRIDHKGKIKLSSFEILRLQTFNEMHIALKGEQKKQWQALSQFEVSDPPPLSLLKSSLRPYQEIGIRWLWFLYSEHLAGLLCDDMGLGKTHQAMALLAASFAQRKGKKSLIVCPTSVIFHWQEKLQQFLPALRVYTLYGTERNFDYFLKQADILLTSYGILRIEQQSISRLSFDIAVFDEVQIAKNHQSQTHKALLNVHTRMKLGLTGTPIENRLRELKALFDLVLPTYMPSEEKYRELFVTPIEKDQDPKAKELLGKFIKPFVLRRKKGEVLLELPEKVEEIVIAEFTDDQRNLYNKTIQEAKNEFSKEFSFVSLFALLTKLKQICDHPSCFLKQPEDYKQLQSGKWNLFMELIDNAIESEQKVVVFSHYLDMLRMMELYLQEKAIAYALIRGDTVNRQEELKRFQEDPNCKIFLGSLQAVGLGVELTAASIVIHYDRWWNPARENQATDRVYRMGQKRGVHVFKLVTKDTIEESIAKMIEKKGKLMEEIIGFDEESTLKQITREEWLEILKIQEA